MQVRRRQQRALHCRELQRGSANPAKGGAGRRRHRLTSMALTSGSSPQHAENSRMFPNKFHECAIAQRKHKSSKPSLLLYSQPQLVSAALVVLTLTLLAWG